MTTFNPYLWAFIILAAFIAVGAFLVQRAYTLNRNPSRKPLPPKERLERALTDMRLRGTATPEDLSAETEAAEEVAAPPPDIPGLPQTPEDMRKQPKGDDHGDGRGRRRSRREG